MELTSFRDLLTPAGQEVLAAAEAHQPVERDFLPHFQQLSRRFPRQLAQAALETAILRLEAAAKFPSAGRMYFTRESLEQATSFAVSSYRAVRYRPYARIADLGCSIGGDTLALAESGLTLGLDRDPLRLALAAANLHALGLAEKVSFAQAELTEPLSLASDASLALFFDPARRTEGRRVFSIKAYQPPLHVVQEWARRFPAIGVKISPGVRMDEVDAYPAEVEFISLRGELKEAVLWLGPLRTAHRRASVLKAASGADRATEIATLFADAPSGQDRERLPLRAPDAYLYEPDPAVLRAGLVAQLGHQLEGAQLDPDIAYLTADHQVTTPFARSWPVEDWFPFGLKRLRAYLRQRNVGRVTVKKRGSPLVPEELIRKLRLEGAEERVVFLTHLQGKPIVIVAGAGGENL